MEEAPASPEKPLSLSLVTTRSLSIATTRTSSGLMRPGTSASEWYFHFVIGIIVAADKYKTVQGPGTPGNREKSVVWAWQSRLRRLAVPPPHLTGPWRYLTFIGNPMKGLSGTIIGVVIRWKLPADCPG